MSGWGLVGCSGQACQTLKQEHSALLAGQKKASAAALRAKPGAPVVALSIHEDVLGEMLAAALAEKTSGLTKTLDVPGGSVRASLKINNLKTSVTERCERCVGLEGGVSLRFTVKLGVLPAIKDEVRGQLRGQLPLRLSGSKKGSQLVADLAGAKVERVDVKIPGIPSGVRSVLNDFATSGARTLLGQMPARLTVATWAPIEVPGARFKLTATALETLPKSSQLWLGFSANLPASGAGLKPSPSLKKGERMAVSFSSPALTGIMGAMMTGGAVPARLDDDLKPDPKGNNLVTLREISPGASGLRTAFTIWHLPESGACYAAEAEGLTTLRVRELEKRGKTRLDVKLEDLRVTATRGDDTLLRIGLWLHSAFVDEALEAETKILTANTLEMGPLGERRLNVGRIDYGADAVTIVGDLR